MYELSVEFEISAAHHLPGYPGNCARPHGHNFRFVVYAQSENLDSVGIAIDFRDLKSATRELEEAWDHQDLNALSDFARVAPSAENLARLAYERLSQAINSSKTRIDRVTVWESARCSATYFKPRG